MDYFDSKDEKKHNIAKMNDVKQTGSELRPNMFIEEKDEFELSDLYKMSKRTRRTSYNCYFNMNESFNRFADDEDVYKRSRVKCWLKDSNYFNNNYNSFANGDDVRSSKWSHEPRIRLADRVRINRKKNSINDGSFNSIVDEIENRNKRTSDIIQNLKKKF